MDFYRAPIMTGKEKMWPQCTLNKGTNVAMIFQREQLNEEQISKTWPRIN